MEWIRSVIRESKVWAMVLGIMGVVWVSGFSARTDELWHRTQWMGQSVRDPAYLADVDLEEVDSDDLADAAAT